MRAEGRRVTRHMRAGPDIVRAQVEEVVRQIEQTAPVNCAAALIVAWLYYGTGHTMLLASCAALLAATIGGLFVLPRTRHCRVRYRDTTVEWHAVHVYAALTGVIWSAVMGIPLVTAADVDRVYLFSTIVSAICTALRPLKAPG